jgi:hypothetical protein
MPDVDNPPDNAAAAKAAGLIHKVANTVSPGNKCRGCSLRNLNPPLVKWCFLAFMSPAIAACAPTQVEELRQFSATAETVRTSVQPLLDDIAVTERSNRHRTIGLKARQTASARQAGKEVPNDQCVGTWIGGTSQGFASDFCIEDAAYYADIGDPPVTSALRHGLDVVVSFAATLRHLMEGGAAQEEAAQIQRLAYEFGALSSVVAGPGAAASGVVAAGQSAGPVGLAGAAMVRASIGPAVEALSPAIEGLLQARDARRARDLILQYNKNVDRLIDALIEGAMQAERILTVPIATDIARGRVSEELVPIQVERVNTFRRLLANYVVMLQRVRELWRTVFIAAQAPPELRATQVADQLIDIRADAEAFRRAYAIIRNPNREE